eukprot:2011586-Lingulodinium_polyedra.AAC.1
MAHAAADDADEHAKPGRKGNNEKERTVEEGKNTTPAALGNGEDEMTHADIAASQGEPAGSAVAERDRL